MQHANSSQKLLKQINSNLKLTIPKTYRQISFNEYEYYLNKGIGYEADVNKIFSFNEVNSEEKFFYILYYQYYTEWVKALLKDGRCNYIWFNLNEYNFKFTHSVRQLFAPEERNQFIQDSISDVTFLGQDVLLNGNYFPFFFFPQKTNGDLRIRLGEHRLYSLLHLNKISKIDTKFLGIIFPKDYSNRYFSNSFSKYSPKNYLPCYILGESPLALYSQKDSNDLYNFEYFTTFSDKLAPRLYNFRKNITPNPLWNNEDVFNDWYK